MGYTGPASGLLDANTNLAYAVPYLANAYKVAGGNPDRAVSLVLGRLLLRGQAQRSAAGASHRSQRAGHDRFCLGFLSVARLVDLFSVHTFRDPLAPKGAEPPIHIRQNLTQCRDRLLDLAGDARCLEHPSLALHIPAKSHLEVIHAAENARLDHA